MLAVWKSPGAMMIAFAVYASAPATSLRAQAAPSVVAGFHSSVYASGLTNPTAIAVGPDRRLYVAEEGGSILAIGGNGTRTIATGFNRPLGLAWNGHVLYVSSTGDVSTLTPSRAFQSFRTRVIVSGLPNGKHQNDGLAFQKGWLYVGVGSTCNACSERDARSGTIMRFHLDGSRGQIYARGLRNPYGLAFRPATGALYATDNGRDDFGNQVPDELNLIVKGANYGWPNCWGNSGGTHCKGTVSPVAVFEPHSSADGLLFYAGRTFPGRYAGDAFIAEWGDSVNGLGTGHRLKHVHFSGKHVAVSDFATGLTDPLALAVAPDGSLLVADWGSGVIWRIQANGH